MIDIPSAASPFSGVIAEQLLASQSGDVSVATAPLAQHSRYRWHPPETLDLPIGFELSLNCITFRDGHRRFIPAVSPKALLLKASVIGHMLLRQNGMAAEASFSYHAMRLIYQHANRQRETFGRQFRRVADLRITPLARAGGESDVLPDSVGLPPNGDGEPWTLSQFVRQGKELLASGEEESDEAIIAAALEGAARRNPFDVVNTPTEQISQLIRISLFDLGPTALATVSQVTREFVVERLLNAIEIHADDSVDDFHAWFFEKRDNLIHQIAKQKKNGGPIDREVVRQVLLETVYSAYAYIAQCVDVAMRAFAEAIPEELSHDERELFDRLYLRNPDLGNFPLMMLYDQVKSHRKFIIEIMNNPCDREPVGVLLRCMQFIAEMTVKRREADRRYKAMRAVTKSRTRRSPSNIPLQPIGFSEVAEKLRKHRGVACRCAECRWLAQLSSESENSNYTFSFECAACGSQAVIEASIEELQGLS